MKKENNPQISDNSRRKFVKSASAVGAGFFIVPSNVISGLGHTPPSDTLNIAGVGVGGMGKNNLKNLASQNIVALCDVDWKYSQKVFETYPKAKKYKDYRRMMDEMGKDIDAVMVATADHTHYIITADAMRAGKHVYVQKPLTHSVYESRMLTKMAEETKVATQMGNQGNSGEGIRQLSEWIWNGEIGAVKEVHAWTNRPIWPQGIDKPTETPAVPDTLAWELFLGPAEWREYSPAYTPWDWRAWWDFGTGALGDMGCHIIDPVFKALDLGYPEAFEASSTPFNIHSAPMAEQVTYYFPARAKKYNVEMPPVKMNWYDGGLKPERPAGLEPGKIPGDWGGGAIFVGEKGTLICSTYAKDPFIVGRENDPPKAPERIRRVENGIGGHEMDWVRACKEDPKNRVEASSNFAYAGPLNEVVVMGNLAVQLQGLNQKFEWDGEAMKITNIPANEKIGIKIANQGKEYKDFNAQEAADNLVKHNYREGWNY